jgi:rod shape-determining protein MreC
MAPSANRRSGHSRRAQYTTFFGYLAGVAGLVIGAGLLLISIFQPDFLSGARAAAEDAASSPGSLTSASRSNGRQSLSAISGYFKAMRNYASLERELAEAKVRLAEAYATEAENRRLKRLLGLASEDPKPVAIARFTASTATSSRRFASVSAGRRDGVKTGMPVRSVLGLVGRVLHAGTSSSRVLLVTDTESLVPVRRAKDGIAAFAQGRGDGRVQIRLVNLGVNPIRKGDVFITSGSGGLYRPGTAIAVADTLASDGAIARVLSDPAATEYVIIEPVWAPESVSAPDAESPKSNK